MDDTCNLTRTVVGVAGGGSSSRDLRRAVHFLFRTTDTTKPADTDDRRSVDGQHCSSTITLHRRLICTTVNHHRTRFRHHAHTHVGAMKGFLYTVCVFGLCAHAFAAEQANDEAKKVDGVKDKRSLFGLGLSGGFARSGLSWDSGIHDLALGGAAVPLDAYRSYGEAAYLDDCNTPAVAVAAAPIGLRAGYHANDYLISKTIVKEVGHPYPVPVEKHVPYPVKVAVPVDRPYPVHVEKPYPVPVEKHVPYPVKVPVPAPYPVYKQVPYPVHVPVDRPYAVDVPKPYPVVVEKKVPYPVEKHVPYPVNVPVDRPYPVHVPVEKRVPYPVEKPVPYPVQVPVDRPYPVTVEKHVPYPVDKPVPYPVEKHVPYPVSVPVKVGVPVPYQVPTPHVHRVDYVHSGYDNAAYGKAVIGGYAKPAIAAPALGLSYETHGIAGAAYGKALIADDC